MRVLDLDPWVEILEAVLPTDQNGLLIRLVPDGDDIELGVLPLDGLHPTELLDGFVAPPEWAALGFITRGWASPMDGVRPSQHPARRRIVGTILLDRLGNTAGRIIDERGDVVIDHPPPEGEVPRLLRSALGYEVSDS